MAQLVKNCSHLKDVKRKYMATYRIHLGSKIRPFFDKDKSLVTAVSNVKTLWG